MQVMKKNIIMQIQWRWKVEKWSKEIQNLDHKYLETYIFSLKDEFLDNTYSKFETQITDIWRLTFQA